MIPAPPPLPYASASTNEDADACPSWIAFGWLVVLLLFGWWSTSVLAGEYQTLGPALAGYLGNPAPTNPWQPRMTPGGGVSGIDLLIEAACTLACAAFLAAVASAALWHWNRQMLWFLLFTPGAALILGLVAPYQTTDRATRVLMAQFGPVSLEPSQKWQFYPMVLAIQVVGATAGLLTGRLVATLVAKALLPPAMRAAVLPYWTAQRQR